MSKLPALFIKEEEIQSSFVKNFKINNISNTVLIPDEDYFYFLDLILR
jgi:hypothetical protein